MPFDSARRYFPAAPSAPPGDAEAHGLTLDFEGHLALGFLRLWGAPPPTASAETWVRLAFEVASELVIYAGVTGRLREVGDPPEPVPPRAPPPP